MTPTPLVVLDVAGLTPALLAHTPRLRAVGEAGFRAELGTVLPAVAASAQATFLTGVPPRQHGIVGSGWYARELGEVLLWRQHHGLVGGEALWAAARRTWPGYRVASLGWHHALGADTDLTVTPLAVSPLTSPAADCHTAPPVLRDRLEAEFGPFPGAPATTWTAGAAAHVLETDAPDLTLVSLPHLAHELQCSGPRGPEAVGAARAVDGAAGRVIDTAEGLGATVVVLADHGITPASRPVDVNRVLRRAGLLSVFTRAGAEELDPWTSRAFAVADHQVAQVYVADPADREPVRELLAAQPGVGAVLDEGGKRAHALDHPRAGELVAVAEPGAWFTYYFWLDDERAPGVARAVAPDRKPGADPAELLAGRGARRGRTGRRRARGLVPLDPTPVAGTHGRLPDSADEGPVLLCSDAALARERVAATEVKGLLLAAAGMAAAE